jgi:hypothetical protein
LAPESKHFFGGSWSFIHLKVLAIIPAQHDSKSSSKTKSSSKVSCQLSFSASPPIDDVTVPLRREIFPTTVATERKLEMVFLGGRNDWKYARVRRELRGSLSRGQWCWKEGGECPAKRDRDKKP